MCKCVPVYTYDLSVSTTRDKVYHDPYTYHDSDLGMTMLLIYFDSSTDPKANCWKVMFLGTIRPIVKFRSETSHECLCKLSNNCISF